MEGRLARCNDARQKSAGGGVFERYKAPSATDVHRYQHTYIRQVYRRAKRPYGTLARSVDAQILRCYAATGITSANHNLILFWEGAGAGSLTANVTCQVKRDDRAGVL